jgi:hypothetical protein
MGCLKPKSWIRFKNMRVRGSSLALLFLAAGCAWNAAGTTGCQLIKPPLPLPDALHESSGVASSLAHPGTIWTHNDGGEPLLYALDMEGRLVARIPFRGGEVWDWEDLAVAECGDWSCLYLADIGDNEELRNPIRFLRIPEPADLEEEAPLTAEEFPITLPDGPRDMEAIFVLPGEEVFFVSKGRRHAQTVYRYPPPLRPGELVQLEEIQTLSPGSMPLPSQVTGAEASRDGTLVAVRTYESLFFYRMDQGRLIPVKGGRVSLGTLQEPQGEGVGFGPAREILLTTEAGNFGGIASLRVLECGGLWNE